MKPIYFLSKTILGLSPKDHDWLVATMRGDLDETQYELIKAVDNDQRKHCYFNKVRIVSLGTVVAVTAIGEVINSSTNIPKDIITAQEFYIGDSPNILPVSFFHVKAPDQKEIIENFAAGRASGEFGTVSFEFVPMLLPYGWIAVPNLIGSYTFIKEE